MAIGPTQSSRPPSYPRENCSYADLLLWHLLVWGTRPGGSVTKWSQHYWTDQEFLDAVFLRDAQKEPPERSAEQRNNSRYLRRSSSAPSRLSTELSEPRNYKNWIGKGRRSAPGDLFGPRIAKALFGGEPQFQIWANDLELARVRSLGEGNNIRTIERDVALAELHQAEANAQPTPVVHPTGHLEKRERADEARNQVDRIIGKLAPPFVGRAADLAKINDFVNARMAGGAEGLLAITAPAGFGKSALAAYWCEVAGKKTNRHIVRHFCFFSGGQATNSPENIRAHLHQQVADLLGQPMDVSLINLLKSAPPGDEQLVVWLDGIDEADDPKSDVIGFLPEKELGERICVIVSARANKDVTPAYLDPWLNQGKENSYRSKRAVHLDKLPFPDVERLVDNVFAKAEVDAPKGLAWRIFNASEQGYALFASIMADTALKDVQQGCASDLHKALDSLRSYAESELTRLGKLPEWRHLRPLFALLTIVKDPLPLDEAEILLGDGEEFFPESFPDGFTRWLNIVEASDRHPMLLSFAHPKLAEVFGQAFDRQRGPRQALTKLCNIFVPEHSDTIAPKPFTRWPSYALKHLPKHLLDAARAVQATEILMDLEFIEVRFAAFGAEVAPPVMAADWMAWYSLAGRKPAQRPIDAMRHLRFWNNYANRMASAASDGFNDAWRQLMADVGLGPSILHAGLIRPQSHILPVSLATLHGHEGGVTGALALADGTGFLSWSEDGTLRLWGRGGEPGPMLRGHKHAIMGAFALPDGAGFVSWSQWDHTLRLWGSIGERGKELDEHKHEVDGALLLADGTGFLSWDIKGILRFWALDGTPYAALNGQEEHPANGPRALVDGSGFLFWSDRGNTLQFWGLEGKPVKVLVEPDGWGNGALALPDGAGFLSWSWWDHTLRLWGPNGEPGAMLDGHKGAVEGALLRPFGAGFLSWSRDETLRFWGPNGEKGAVLSGHKGMVNGALVLPDGAGFLSWGKDGTLRFWGPNGEKGAVLSGHENAVNGALILADSKSVLSWGWDWTLRLWDLGGALDTLPSDHAGPIKGVLALADDAGFLSWGWDYTLQLWGPNGEPGIPLLRPEASINSALALANGDGFVSLSEDGRPQLWGPNHESGDMVLYDHELLSTPALMLGHDAGHLTWTGNGELVFWEPYCGLSRVLHGHRGQVRGAVALGDGSGFLSWGLDDRLILWDRQGKLKNLWLSPDGPIAYVKPCDEKDRYLVAFGCHFSIVHLAQSRNYDDQ